MRCHHHVQGLTPDKAPEQVTGMTQHQGKQPDYPNHLGVIPEPHLEVGKVYLPLVSGGRFKPHLITRSPAVAGWCAGNRSGSCIRPCTPVLVSPAKAAHRIIPDTGQAGLADTQYTGPVTSLAALSVRTTAAGSPRPGDAGPSSGPVPFVGQWR